MSTPMAICSIVRKCPGPTSGRRRIPVFSSERKSGYGRTAGLPGIGLCGGVSVRPHCAACNRRIALLPFALVARCRLGFSYNGCCHLGIELELLAEVRSTATSQSPELGDLLLNGSSVRRPRAGLGCCATARKPRLSPTTGAATPPACALPPPPPVSSRSSTRCPQSARPPAAGP